MENHLQKWAVILGGSSGLGLASARALAKEGFHICLVHRDRKSEMETLQLAIAEMESLGVQVKSFNRDALKLETLNEVVEALPNNSVGVLLHSIAKGTVKPLSHISLEDFKITLDAMALSWWQWTAALVAEGKFAEGAQNLAFTSEGNTRVWKGYGAVSVAKAALEALMRQMAVEYAPHGIATNCIQAGVTDTPSLRHIPGYDALLKSAAQRNPFSKVTTPEAVGGVVVALCKEGAGWINGTVIKADGGESLR
ncbi:SDR family oxidoreductase [Aureisphaera galaxeae]|uniref:SDR family oxidoreductase n=1 Tax=Aureisphaera galaxeae TaxID=1538023 RepID=UPI00234FED69|nr:SDR family oxidoreductase [Aureisphaera galaxeae]MDC8004223.1 SDR family oxidoreductase [Aureisphaera galaxeae]